MSHLATSGNRTGGFTSSVVRIFVLVVLRLASSRIDTRANVTPSTIVQRLFLTPEKISIRILIKMGSNLDSSVSFKTSDQKCSSSAAPCHKGKAKVVPRG